MRLAILDTQYLYYTFNLLKDIEIGPCKDYLPPVYHNFKNMQHQAVLVCLNLKVPQAFSTQQTEYMLMLSKKSTSLQAV